MITSEPMLSGTSGWNKTLFLQKLLQAAHVLVSIHLKFQEAYQQVLISFYFPASLVLIFKLVFNQDRTPRHRVLCN